ncbi:MAG: rhodanese-like domain-containing protein [Alphaproteobacteria bacterium]|nr:rhodanese-like domain-containing protein [Rhodospirillaceae bacterium]MBT6206336.1 rhodanese-like domain-containing protein [Rhodospirillaceae bacterium]MBT6510616.1 rhodanese-like domain-containing protein [Rhodospirillaceae bacterium]MBT7649023.1 rhodanese-like domain-containing protein [Rhodospirillaceae bacterium]MDG2482940.1 rhodanese-like domain-containing protein [Alphaproteobacteria bacterium]
MAQTVKDMMMAARDGLVELSPQEAQARLEADDAVFVDVRDGLEVKSSGTLPGAVVASRGMLEFFLDPAMPMHDARLKSGKTVIFYCASGGRSALSSKTARDMGYDDVAHIAGGFGAWAGEGRPVDSGVGR